MGATSRRTRFSGVAAALIGLAAAATVIVAPQGADAETSVRLTAVGDIGYSAEAAATLTKIGELNPDAHMALGDLAYTGDPETQWCDFVKSKVGADFPFELVAGNHESNGQHGHINNFSACLPNQIPGVRGTYGREYLYDLPRSNPLVRVVNISAGQTFPEGTWNYAKGDAHYQWLAAAIDQARSAGIPWVIVNNHFPCLSVSTYGCTMPSSVFTLLQEKRVDLVLSGHDHAYMRTHQLRSGVSGCPAIPVDSYDADCVADRDNTFASGQGTVFATVGTGGVPLRNIDNGDAEYPYFAKASGLNLDPTWGALDLTIGATELSASFVRSTGGSLSDGFRLTKAANQPPTAAFTASTSGLTVVTDASTSSDPDGTVSSYAWQFGDGATATGKTPPPHSYSTGGTYPVTLTVTDNAGATATSTQDVTVSPPAAGVPPAPVGLSGSADTQTKINLSWTAVPNASAYRVLRNGVEVGQPTNATFTDTGLAPATSYRYSVRAANSDGVGPAGSEVVVTTRTYAVSGDRWRANDTGANLGTSWRDPSYNDSSWKSGPTQMGYGDGDEATLLTWGSNAATKPITVYARSTFDAGTSIADVTGLQLRAMVDDGAVVYLNGTEVWRFNLPTGTVTNTTRASRFIAGAEEQQWRTVTLPTTALRTGQNTIAVEVHQDLPSSSDLTLDLELRPVR